MTNEMNTNKEQDNNMAEYEKYQLNKEAKINFKKLAPEDQEEFKANHPFFRKNEDGEIEYRTGIGFWEDGDRKIFLAGYNKVMDLAYGLAVVTGAIMVTYSIVVDGIIPLVKEYIIKK